MQDLALSKLLVWALARYLSSSIKPTSLLDMHLQLDTLERQRPSSKVSTFRRLTSIETHNLLSKKIWKFYVSSYVKLIRGNLSWKWYPEPHLLVLKSLNSLVSHHSSLRWLTGCYKRLWPPSRHPSLHPCLLLSLSLYPSASLITCFKEKLNAVFQGYSNYGEATQGGAEALCQQLLKKQRTEQI